MSQPDYVYTETEAAVIVDAATRAAEPNPLDPDVPLYTIVTGDKVEVIDTAERLAKHGAVPKRATGTHLAATVQSFVDLLHRHDGANGTLTVWVHPTSGRIVGVLNDHGRDQDPQWGDHRVALDLIWTEEWKRWAALDGKLVDQAAFAEHIQEGLTEIADPPAADLLEVVQTMQGSKHIAWKSGHRIVDGAVQMEYSEDVTATAGRNSQLDIPAHFVLVMAPFVGEDPETVEADLRWRVREGGKLAIGYKVRNPESVVRNTLEKIAERLRDEFPGIVYLGTPR